MTVIWAATVYKPSATLLVLGTLFWVALGLCAWIGYHRVGQRLRRRQTERLLNRPTPDGVLHARVFAGVATGATPARLVEVAQGRVAILEHALAIAEQGVEQRAPVAEHVERLRAAVRLAKG